MTDQTAAVVVVRCLGRSTMTVAGAPADLSALRPGARSLFRWLAAEADRAVHREVLIDGLWPAATRTAGIRRLHVAMSSLNAFLEPADAALGRPLVVRDGQSYALDARAHADVASDRAVDVDVAALRHGLHEARDGASPRP